MDRSGTSKSVWGDPDKRARIMEGMRRARISKADAAKKHPKRKAKAQTPCPFAENALVEFTDRNRRRHAGRFLRFQRGRVYIRVQKFKGPVTISRPLAEVTAL